MYKIQIYTRLEGSYWNLEIESRDAVKRSVLHRTASTMESYLSQNEIKKTWSNQILQGLSDSVGVYACHCF